MNLPFFKKKVIVVFVSLMLIAFLSVSAYKWNLVRQCKQLESEARISLDTGDYKHASMAIRRLLRVDPDNVDAMLLTAELMDNFNPQEALQWRYSAYSRRVEDSDLLKQVLTDCVVNGDYAVLKHVLELAKDSHSDKSQYWTYLGVLYSKDFELEKAEQAFAKAQEISPGQRDILLNLAILRLFSDDETVRIEAEKTLHVFLGEEKYTERALLQLFDFYIKKSNKDRFVRLIKEFCEGKNISFPSQKKALDGMYYFDYEGTRSYLKSLAVLYQEDTRVLNALVSLLNLNEKFSDALYFINEIDPELCQQVPLAITIGESYLFSKDWANLDDFLTKANFSTYPYVKRLFELELSYEDKGMSEYEYKQGLKGLIRDYSEDPVVWPRLLALSQTWNMYECALAFQWKEWELSKDIKCLRTIYEIAKETGDALQMYQALSVAVKADASDVLAKNNLSYLGFILGYNLSLFHNYAEDNFSQNPEDVRFVFTKSLSLYEQGKFLEANSLLSNLLQKDSESPKLKLFQVVYLSAIGEKQRAEELFSSLNETDYIAREWEFAKTEMTRH